MTFASSPGSDALASGIRLEEMWVGRIVRYTHTGRNTEAGGFFLLFERLWESVPMQICCVILMSCDVLCRVPVMMADLCVHTYACLSV